MVLQKMKFLCESFLISFQGKDIVEDLLHEEPYFFCLEDLAPIFLLHSKAIFLAQVDNHYVHHEDEKVFFDNHYVHHEDEKDIPNQLPKHNLCFFSTPVFKKQFFPFFQFIFTHPFKIKYFLQRKRLKHCTTCTTCSLKFH